MTKPSAESFPLPGFIFLMWKISKEKWCCLTEACLEFQLRLGKHGHGQTVNQDVRPSFPQASGTVTRPLVSAVTLARLAESSTLGFSFTQALRRNPADIVKVQVHKIPSMTRQKDILLVTNKQESRGSIVNFHQFISICSYLLNYPKFIQRQLSMATNYNSPSEKFVIFS